MRLVSLCPSTTELLFDLGAGAEVVGVTKFCLHPADRLSGIARVGGTKDPDRERILALRPDLVLLNREENRLEDAQWLSERGVRVHDTFPRTVLETAASVRSIGLATGHVRQAEELARRIEVARLDLLQARLSPVSYVYLIWRKPWMVAGADTYVDDLLGLAGGSNLARNLDGRYPELGVSDLECLAPDLVLLSSEPFPFKQRHVSELCEATGFSSARFRFVDGELLSWHGSRTLQGIPYAARVLHSPEPVDT